LNGTKKTPTFLCYCPKIRHVEIFFLSRRTVLIDRQHLLLGSPQTFKAFDHNAKERECTRRMRLSAADEEINSKACALYSEVETVDPSRSTARSLAASSVGERIDGKNRKEERKVEKRTARPTGRTLGGHTAFLHSLRRRPLCYHQPEALGSSRECHHRLRRIKLQEKKTCQHAKCRRKYEEGRSGSQDARSKRFTCHAYMASYFNGVEISRKNDIHPYPFILSPREHHTKTTAIEKDARCLSVHDWQQLDRL